MSNKLPFWLKPHVSFLNKDSMHHAFLISGRKGVGKGQLVHYLSEFILCNDSDIDICGNCSSCKFSSFENHPDYHELQVLPDKKLIGISQIHDPVSYTHLTLPTICSV